MDTLNQVEEFYKRYTGRKEILAYSACNQPIYAFYIGKEEDNTPKILAQYGMHAREWITTHLALYHIERGISDGYAVIVPLVNPDGVALATRGQTFLQTLSMDRQAFLYKANGASTDFSLWKANANAVDINVNFDADWGEGVSNIRYPSFENFIGNSVASEIETQALVALTKKFLPNMTFSYHSKGEEIYWYYKQEGDAYRQAEVFANYIAERTGYTAKKISGSCGGYKDWCILKKKLLALTIEVGKNSWKHPIGVTHLPELIQRNGNSLQDAINFYKAL